jgi:hypothetical protein
MLLQAAAPVKEARPLLGVWLALRRMMTPHIKREQANSI